jgi:hypothetical protein
MFDLIVGIDAVRRRTEGSIAADHPARSGRSASSRPSSREAVSTLTTRVLAALVKPVRMPSGRPPARRPSRAGG